MIKRIASAAAVVALSLSATVALAPDADAARVVSPQRDTDWPCPGC